MAGRGVDIKLGGNPGSQEKYEEVKKLGGLFVLGTERHEARRIDNQLRGRSGRQGDEGETQFFVSLEDSLMRVFASDMIKKMMGRFGIAEDEPIQNSLITRSLESAQTKIEGFNFDSRKHILEYDDIMNQQRSAVYDRRRKIMLGTKDEIRKELEELIVEDEGIQKIVESKEAQLGEEQFLNTFRKLTLQVIDMLWVEHLEVMDYTRGSVNLRAYGQRDPLIEYKKEGLRLFKDMEMSIDDNVLKLLPNIGGEAFTQERQKVKEIHEEGSILAKQPQKPQDPIATDSSTDKTHTPSGEKIGRNDPCYCGSGKKFKKCHGE
jgi:preprotein translocase subunit SecA